MDFERIRALIDLIASTPIEELTLEENGSRLHLRQQNSHRPAVRPSADFPADRGVPKSLPEVLHHGALTDSVRAQMPGTIYLSPEPDEPAFVTIGTSVKVGQKLAIIEAMKTMMPVTASVAGVVTSILVANEEAVAQDQPLFGVEPDRKASK